MFNERTTLRVGAVVSLLLMAAVVFALLIDFRDLGPSIRVQVFLEHPGALRAEADMQLAGRQVGRVESIRLVSSHQARDPTHLLHPKGGVVLEVLVRKKYLRWIRKNGEIFVNAKGLIGEAYLEVSPPAGNVDMERAIQQGDVIRGIDPARMEHILVTSFLNARRLGKLLEELKPSMDQLKEESTKLADILSALEVEPETYHEIGSLVSKAHQSFRELQATLTGKDVPSLEKLQRQSEQFVALVRAELSSVSTDLDVLNQRLQAVRHRLPDDFGAKIQQVGEEAKQNLAKLEGTIAKLEELAKRVAAGEGTVGALMNDPEFSDDAKQLGRYLKRHPWKIIKRPPN